jgi:outer membrane receptor protein involved in Fe transport
VNPGYLVMAIGANVQAHRALSLFVRVDNLADREYDSALGYPGLPRAVVAGARFNVAVR